MCLHFHQYLFEYFYYECWKARELVVRIYHDLYYVAFGQCIGKFMTKFWVCIYICLLQLVLARYFIYSSHSSKCIVLKLWNYY